MAKPEEVKVSIRFDTAEAIEKIRVLNDALEQLADEARIAGGRLTKLAQKLSGQGVDKDPAGE